MSNWTARPSGDSDGLWTVEDEDGQIVFFGMDEARACLFAAAPELLEALQACAKILPRYYLSGKTVGDDEEHSAVLERVLEAIAKAESQP